MATVAVVLPWCVPWIQPQMHKRRNEKRVVEVGSVSRAAELRSVKVCHNYEEGDDLLNKIKKREKFSGRGIARAETQLQYCMVCVHRLIEKELNHSYK